MKLWVMVAVNVPLQNSYGDQVSSAGSLRAADQKKRAKLGWMKACVYGTVSVCVCRRVVGVSN